MNPKPLEIAFEKAIGRPLKGYVILGDRRGILLVFKDALSVELRSDSRIEAALVDPTEDDEPKPLR